MQMKRYVVGAVVAGAMALASCGDDGESLEDGWNDLSEEEQTAICEVFNSDEMTDEMMQQVVDAANEENDSDVTADEFRTFLDDNC